MKNENNNPGLKQIPPAVAWSGAIGMLAGASEVLFSLPRTLLKPGSEFEAENILGAIANPLEHTFVRDNIIAFFTLGVLAGLLFAAVNLVRARRSGNPFCPGNTSASVSTLVILIEVFFYVSKILPPAVGKFLFAFGPARIAAMVLTAGLVIYLCHRANRQKTEPEKIPAAALRTVLVIGALVLSDFVNIFRDVTGTALMWTLIAAVVLAFYGLSILMKNAVARRAESADGRRALGGKVFLALAWLLAAYLYYHHFIGFKSVPSPGAGPGGPNLVMLVMDTVRYDRLSLNGYERDTTPFLKELSKVSVVFDRAYTVSPWTLPSHASFFTGLYPSEHRAVHGNWHLDDDYVTLAERLKDRGYVTLGYSSNPYISRYSNLDQGFDRMLHPRNMFISSAIFAGEGIMRALLFVLDPAAMAVDSGSAQANQTAVEWIDELGEKDSPFFLFINYMEAHPPYPHNRESYHFFPDYEEAKQKLRETNVNWVAYEAGRQEVSEEELEMYRTWYDGCLYYLDARIKEVYMELAKTGVLENTVVVIMSDHGESLSERGYWGHGFGMYHELLRVPLMIRYPRGIPRGYRYDAPFSLKDLPENIMEMINGSEPEFLANPPPPDTPLYAERYRPVRIMNLISQSFPGWDKETYNRDQKSVIRRQTHFIWDSKGADELYDLAADPEELDNLVERERNTFYEMNNLMNGFIQDHPQPKFSGKGDGSLDPETVRRLRALGYMK